jgi:fatty acid desaturase
MLLSSCNGMIKPITFLSQLFYRLAFLMASLPNRVLSHYTELLARVRSAGLLEKTPGWYVKRIVFFCVAAVVLWGGAAVLAVTGAAWGWMLLIMAVIGVVAAQFGFIAHEAAHRQVFRSNRLNDWAGLVLANLCAGLSYGFWLRKHNRHHAKPNQVDYDPDIDIRVLSFTQESLQAKKGPERWLSRRQGWLFPVLLFFTGFDLLLDSIIAVARGGQKRVGHRSIEFAMMLVRQIAPFALLWWWFGFWPAVAGWFVQMLCFGFFMGAAFAPNHKGMPLVPKDAKIDFFERQVLTSRNIRSTWLTDNLMGGLNFQVEHHLFPSMARPHLKKAHAIVTEYCRERDVPFVEMGLFPSYGVVIQYLNRVGLSERDPFVCPMVAQLRPRH